MEPDKYQDICKCIKQISIDANKRKLSEGYKIVEDTYTSPKIIEKKVDNSLDKINKIFLKDKNSNIGIFLSSINCDDQYSREELENLLEKSKYKQPKAIFHSITNPESTWGPGYIFELNNNKYNGISKFK